MDVQSPAMIDVQSVSKRYGRTLALDDVSVVVEPGELFALLGPNGAGKTTLVHILSTIQRPDEGTATIAGIDVVRQPLAVRKHLGVVFQESTLDERLTVAENLDFHGLIYGVPANLRRKRIQHLLDIVELGEWREAFVRNLSGGMKRRLEIARELVHDARVIFLDEPTVGLDVQLRERIWAYIGTLHRQRELTILVTTHYIGEVEGCDRVCIIDRGKVIASDSPDDLKREHGTEFLRVKVADESERREIAATFGESMVGEENELVIPMRGDRFMTDFVEEYGNSIDFMSVERSNLESVFLSLTGHELRDQEASAAERTRSFGRRGGEHTR